MTTNPSDPRNLSDMQQAHPLIKATEPSIDLVQLALRNVVWLVIAGVAGLVLGVASYKAMGPSYVANTQILVKLKTPVPLRDESNGPRVGERSAHVEIIRSPRVIERAVQDSGLDQLASLRGSDDPAQDIIEGLKISRTAGEDHHQLNILNLGYTCKSGEDAKAILNAIVKAYDDYLHDDAQKNHQELSLLLKQINNDLAPRLAEKTREYQQFREETPLLWKAPPGASAQPNDVTNIHHQRVDAVAAERVKVELLYQEITSRLQTIRQAIARGESPEALLLLVKTFLQRDQQSNTQTVVTGASERQQLDGQLIPLMLEEQMLLQRYSSNHPDVVNVRDRIEIIKSYYRRMGIELPVASHANQRKLGPNGEVLSGEGAELISMYLIALTQQQAELNNRLSELQKLFDASTVQAKEYSRYEARDQILRDELERIKSLHDVVVNRIEELSLARDEGYQLQQISPSRADQDFKRLIKIVGGIFVVSVLMAYAGLFLRELQDTSLKSLADMRSLCDAPILGTLPNVVNPQKNLASARETGLSPMLYYYHDPGSPEAEACRSVRSTFFVHAHDHKSQIIQFSSPEPGDGKTTTISNLAIAIAQTGKRVLLIDADLRRPMVHRLFGLREEIGLSEVLQGELELVNATQSTQVENLSVLTAGNLPSKPAELLSSAKLHYLLGDAKRDYDIILIDSPPVLAVSDPCILAQSADALMLVVRMNKNRRPSVKRTLELLDSHGIPLLGVIANGLQAISGEYMYQGGYSGGYTRSSRPQTARNVLEVQS
ncbi:MAG: polysaccharide biosynthesis tyrosine autokinase [Planctomycetaceae bacterium]|nr:polysaccharide biosynthesis tyrosine autokinase [Planctomycetaceae bacterium]